ncbi:MAG: Rid family detoxifying hydrolase [Syntrophales bacterium]|nr:Rid family detoxifying hydrolase [Syntrophales bacterium]
MKKEIRTDKAPQPIGPYSQGLVVGNMIFVAGQGPLNPETGKTPPTIGEQTRQVMTNIKNILEAGGATMDNVVKSTVHLADLKDFQAFNEVYREFFTAPYPVRTTVGSSLLGILVEIDVIAEI